MLNTSLIIVDLLLHLTLVLLQLGQPLLHQLILFFLRRDSMVVGVADQLQLRYEVGHIVLINGLKDVSHLFNLSAIQLGQLLVLFQLRVSIGQLALVKIKD